MHALRKAVLASTLTLGVGALGAGMMAAAVAEAADPRVTLMLRSGETVSGRFDGVDQDQFHLDVSDTDERKIPLGQIAVIDLAGGAANLPETELREARGASHVLVTRGGSLVKGQLVKIEGARITDDPNPAEIRFRTEGGEERRMPLADVTRLYLGNYPGAAPGTSTTTSTQATGGVQVQGQTRVVTLPGTTQWIDTGITVRQGDPLVISATGEVQFSGSADDKATPNGSVRGAKVPGAPVPAAPAGALIGRIGTGAAFGIGQNATINAPNAGRLFIGVNDDNVGDNAGQFEVRVTPTSTGGARRR